MPLKWTIGTTPNVALANTMLKNAIATLAPTEKPIVHSDRGCHYRWPEWIRIMTEAGMKTEMFYGHNWDDYSIDEFIPTVDTYMH